MKYSIIIPTLNEEKLLPVILNQLTDSEFRKKFEIEIIVSDGGSSDKTLEIAANSADILKIFNKDYKQNIAEGRNEGAAAASGEILVFINADIIFPDIINFFNYVEENFIGSDYLAMTCRVVISPQEAILSDKLFHAGYNRYFKFLNKIGVGMGRGECQIIHSDVFKKLGGYNTALAAGEDFDLFRRVRKSGKILFSDEVCIYESPRRYRKFGYSGVTWLWIKNGLSVLFKNKSISKEWEQVR